MLQQEIDRNKKQVNKIFLNCPALSENVRYDPVEIKGSGSSRSTANESLFE